MHFWLIQIDYYTSPTVRERGSSAPTLAIFMHEMHCMFPLRHCTHAIATNTKNSH